MLTKEQFRRFKELMKRKNELTDEEKSELSELKKLKASKPKDEKPGGKHTPWGNDFGWWNKYSALMKDATNVAMNWIPGTGLNKGNELTESGRIVETAGAISITMANVYGAEDDITSPVNVQCRNLWLAMHRKYRGLNSYQAADLGAVVIAGIEVISTITELERVYGVINYYSINNRNLPYTLLAAMGVSVTLADNIRANLSDFRYGLNVLLMRAQNILVPKDMSAIDNKISLYGYIYSDHKSVRSQNYVFTSIATAKFSATLAGGSAVIFDRTKTIHACSTYQDVLTLLSEPIAALVEDDDVNKMYSDLLAYLGNEAFVQINLIPENYITVPVYDESILHKIHNLKTIASVMNNDGETASLTWPSNHVVPMLYARHNYSTSDIPNTQWAITQHDNVLCTKVSLGDENQNGSRVYNSSSGEDYWELDGNYFFPAVSRRIDASLLDTYLDEMDEEHICEGVLFKPSFDDRGITKKIYISRSCAFEIPCYMTAFINRRGTVNTIPVVQYAATSGYMNSSELAAVTIMALQSLMVLSQFDWAPIFYTVIDDDVDNFYFDDQARDPSGTATNGVVFGLDIDNCRFVTYSEIFRIHETAVLSGLYTTAAATEADRSK